MIALTSPLIGDEEIAAVEGVLRSGHVVQGPEVAAFETEFASLVASRKCIAVNSGTSALLLALVALGIGPGDEVVVPSFTFAATANAIRLAGAEPVFADVERESFTLDPKAAAAAVTGRTAAVMAVHLYGHPARMAELSALCDRNGLALVEDAAQAHASALDGTPAGAWGRAAAFSFYATKNMTTGEGGMVVVPDEATARVVRLLRNQGMESQYANELVGYNMRMTDIQAAIGRVQLSRLGALTDIRRKHAAALDAGLADAVPVPKVAPGAVHVYHQYTVRIRASVSGGRDGVVARLQTAGVEARAFYPTPVHRLASFDRALDLPETERAAAEVLSLPVGPHVSDGDIETVGAAVRAAVTP